MTFILQADWPGGGGLVLPVHAGPQLPGLREDDLRQGHDLLQVPHHHHQVEEELKKYKSYRDNCLWT